ncbi:MAG: hypothetical protein PHI12_11335 [Dehalococcoidales bacterium]|nr:hypothetical protein [Dehalococcoidales bacterium]
MEDMWAQYKALVDGVKITTLVVLIAIDLLLGIIIAIKEKTFKFSKLANFFNTSILGMVGGYFLVGGLCLVHPEFDYLVVGAWGLIDVGLLGMIWNKLSKLGLPIPKIV